MASSKVFLVIALALLVVSHVQQPAEARELRAVQNDVVVANCVKYGAFSCVCVWLLDAVLKNDQSQQFFGGHRAV